MTKHYPPARKDESPSLQEVSDSLERQREKVRRFYQRTKPKVLGEEMKRLLDKLGRSRRDERHSAQEDERARRAARAQERVTLENED